ncbi:MAG: hypothetical protein IPL31_12715 [Saprospiraceae bacterium]|nr:hypothetical protein [Saprospiraceae bacterium]
MKVPGQANAQATGNSTHDIACVIQTIGCPVSGIGTPPDIHCKWIINGTFDLPNCPTDLTVNAVQTMDNCDEEEYYYKFQLSYDGVHYYTVCNTTTPSCVINVEDLPQYYLYIRLTVTLGSDVLSVDEERFIYRCFDLGLKQNPDPNEGSNKIDISYNTTMHSFQVDWNKSEEVNLSIYDITGKLLWTKSDHKLSEGGNIILSDIKLEKNKVIIFQVASKDKSYASRIIII